MAVTLEAGFVYTQNDGEVAMVGFADDQYDTQRYVLLQRALNPKQSDKDLGHDAVHVTINGENCSGYGGVMRFTLGAFQAILLLSAEMAAELNTDEEHLIVLKYPELDREELCARLRLLFVSEPDSFVLE